MTPESKKPPQRSVTQKPPCSVFAFRFCRTSNSDDTGKQDIQGSQVMHEGNIQWSERGWNRTTQCYASLQRPLLDSSVSLWQETSVELTGSDPDRRRPSLHHVFTSHHELPGVTKRHVTRAGQNMCVWQSPYLPSFFHHILVIVLYLHNFKICFQIYK